MSMNRVAFVTPGSYPLPSPGSSSVERVVEHIVPLLAPHIEPRIYGRTARHLPRRGIYRGVTCCRYPAASKPRYVRLVGSALRSFAPQLTVVENRPLYVLRLRRQRPRARIWLNLHSSTFLDPARISRTALRESFRQAERIIVNSEYLRDVAAGMVPEANGKLRVVHLGVESSRFLSQYSLAGAQMREELRTRRGWHGRKVLLFMGRLLPRKGVHHLLHVLPDLVQAHPDVLLVIVGSAFYGSHRMTPYTRQLHRLGNAFPGHVKFVPYVPYSEVPSWFIGADLAVVPSDRREAFGLVNVEAMACGLPVVGTRAGGMKEVIEEGVTGFLVDPEHPREELKDRLIWLMHNEDLRCYMGQRARERVEQLFTWEQSAARWLELLREGGYA
ncbi:glycosyltransferase family 4 protein [Paenibacillus sp. 1P07SE]|uniref:glycosyltransferase family 4 protein n=1 Tax=Paenibacillus sp. 1P07SE TaxID=3132209 RepID=UPI0039A5B820